MKLVKKYHITGTIHTLTGLHIGGTNNAMEIGGIDNAVIRHPITNEPFIPGSSLKGKMRSLLELVREEYVYGNMGIIKNVPSNNPKHLSARLFGFTGKKKDSEDDFNTQQPSRLIVRDAVLKDEKITRKKALSEIKSETVIDRLTSAAMPRQLERVPSGTEFKLDIILNIFSEDSEEEMIKGVFSGLELITDDYLGGAGSRGSGQVKFTIENVQEIPSEYYKGEIEKPQPCTEAFIAKNYIPISMR